MDKFIMVRPKDGTTKEMTFSIYKESTVPDLSEHKFLRTKTLSEGTLLDEYVHKDDYDRYKKLVDAGQDHLEVEETTTTVPWEEVMQGRT
jgi:hypothetical protein